MVAIVLEASLRAMSHGHFLIVVLTELGDEFAKEDCAAVSKDCSVLLRTMGSHIEGTFVDDTALEHESAWLVNGNSLAAQFTEEVSGTSI